MPRFLGAVSTLFDNDGWKWSEWMNSMNPELRGFPWNEAGFSPKSYFVSVHTGVKSFKFLALGMFSFGKLMD